ncbi:MAG: RIP metalloprotease RseP [Desulfovibrionaceae bacterium]|nr:RIP metalloprotease RseP [Desulfovibrionaceae bacterium]
MDWLLSLFSHWQAVLAIVLVLGGLIFFHELGHFSVARLFDIGVRTFSLGFGPRLWGVRRGKTEYRLSLVPLGGYVALVGETPDTESEETLKEDARNNVSFTEEESFARHPAWQRLLVVLAGPLANLLLAFLIYFGVAAVVGHSFITPEVGGVEAGSPAEKAGLQKGDILVRVDGQPVQEWGQIGKIIEAGGGKAVSVIFERRDGDGKLVILKEITPEAGTRTNVFGEKKPAWLIGISASGRMDARKLGLLDAVAEGWSQTWRLISLTIQSFVKLFQRAVPLDQVGGPILIAQMVGEQASHGLISVLSLAAFISINLGILNLLPVPVLDGGTSVFLLLEMAMRRPLPEKVRDIAMRVGLGLLLGLMIFATWNDIVRLFS